MTLRVGFNAYLLSSPQLRGWQRYTLSLLAALPAHGVRPVLYSLAPLHADHIAQLPAGSFECRVGPQMRYLTWEQLAVPRQLREDRIDAFHCPMNYGMPWRSAVPRVLTLHDAIDELYYWPMKSIAERLRPNAMRARLANRIARRAADRIITVSEHAKSDIVRALGVPRSSVSVVYEAAAQQFHGEVRIGAVEELRARMRLTKPYFLYVGGLEARKNISFLVRSFAELDVGGVDLALAGGNDNDSAQLVALATELGCGDRLKTLGYVQDDDLPALYRGALAFVYPSEYEGFGLQLVEAMAMGCAVLASRATSLPEILGSGGECFALDGVEELKALMRRVAVDPSFRAELSSRARRRSAAFSWDRAARETVAVYRQAIDR